MGESTEYTIHWTLKNSATDLRDVEVKTTLPPDVQWTGLTQSAADATLRYAQESREVVWRLPRIRAMKGSLGDPPLEVVFQIAAIPGETHVGQFQRLTNETTVRAIDEFTGLLLSLTAAGVDTSLPQDSTVGQEGGRVISNIQ